MLRHATLRSSAASPDRESIANEMGEPTGMAAQGAELPLFAHIRPYLFNGYSADQKQISLKS
jgi:hypothetical protein